MTHRLRLVLSCAVLLCGFVSSRTAAAQPPPGKGTDMELDPDSKPAEPPPEEEKKPAELPPPEEGAWGVGGKEQEGRFAPGGLKKDEKQGPEEKPDGLPPPGAGGVEVFLGFGSIRDVTNDTESTQVFVASFVLGFQYRFGETWTAGLRFPYSTGSTDAIGDTDDFNSFAVGNMELSVRPAFRLTPRLRLPVGLAMDLPFASGDLFPSSEEQGSRAQALIAQSAIAARGYEEYALFASKRFGIVPSAGLMYDRAPIHAALFTKIELMFKTGGNDPPSPPPLGESQGIAHDPATNWVTGLSFAYDFLGGKLTPMLRTWVAVARPPVSVGTSDYAGAIWAIEPRVMAKLPFNATGSPALQGGVGYVLPIAGELGGNATATGVRILVSLLF
jgi:hypothetical protein